MSASQTFTVLSPLPLTMRLPSGLNATLLHAVRVSLEGEDFLARLRVPHLSPSCLDLAAADDAFAVGAERHAADLARCVP